MRTDIRQFETVEPRDVVAYIGSMGWVLDDGQPAWMEGTSQLWVNRETSTKLVVPLRRDFRNYSMLLADLCATVAEDKRMDTIEVLRQITAAAFDTIRLRVASPGQDDSLRLSDAVVLVRETNYLIAAAAQSRVEPRPWHPKARPPAVQAYIDRLQMAQTERGSFVLAIRSPVDEPVAPRDDQARLPLGDSADEPEPADSLTGRDMALTLFDAVAAARNALPLLADRNYSRFDEVVNAGVSANLYTALSQLSRVGRANVELSVGWSPKLPLDPEDRDRLSLPQVLHSEQRGLYAEAAKRLRSLTDLTMIQVTGQTVDVHREPSAILGRVSIRTPIAGTLWKVWLVLGDAEYRLALGAHAARRTLTCRGTAHKHGRDLIIDSPIDLRVVDG